MRPCRSALRMAYADGTHGNSTASERGARLQMHASSAAGRPVTDHNDGQTRRDLRVAIIFGVVAASLELGILIYFFR